MRNNAFIAVSIATVCWMIIGIIVRAQTAPRLEPLSLDVVENMVSFDKYGSIDVSPDGRFVAYTLVREVRDQQSVFTATGVPHGLTDAAIWVTDLSSGKAERLSPPKGVSWGGVWSPDSRRVAFLSDADGVARIWIGNPSTGDVGRLADVTPYPGGNRTELHWAPDSRTLVVKALKAGVSPQDLDRKSEAPPRNAQPTSTGSGSTATVFEAPTIPKDKLNDWRRDPEMTDSFVLKLARLDRSDDAEIAIIDTTTGAVKRLDAVAPAHLELSPDGHWLAYSSLRKIVGYYAQLATDFFVAPLETGVSLRVAADVNASGNVMSWSPDSTLIAYSDDDGQLFTVGRDGSASPRLVTPGTHPPFSMFQGRSAWNAAGTAIHSLADDTVWRIRLEDGTLEKLASAADGEEWKRIVRTGGKSTYWTADAVTIGVHGRRRDTQQDFIVFLDAGSGSVVRRRLFDRQIGSIYAETQFDCSDDGKIIAFVSQDAAHAPDIVRADASFENERRVTRINPGLDEVVMGVGRLISWQTERGGTLHGGLLLPSNHRVGESVPLIVFPYSSTRKSQWVHQFGIQGIEDWTGNLQLLATRGYAVLSPDFGEPRNERLKQVRGLLPGLDKLAAEGIADPDRLGVMGFSNGGYDVLALLTQTTRFRAAICGAGIANLISDYNEMAEDGKPSSPNGVPSHNRNRETLWENRDIYIANTPILYFDRVTTPTMFHAGGKDPLARQMSEAFISLRRFGIETMFVRYEGEGHGLRLAANKRDYAERMIAWFDRHLEAR